ncbi:MAG: TetR/AcrR family transcriptional regulator [Myxococcales bacterium]|nr:TetR/AcrR family transcriptional regulator [Myxococcales bacterium]
MTTRARQQRRDRNVERARRDIVAAAARALSSKGLGAATMEDIAAEAGYAVGTLYKYFDSKNALVEAMFISIGEELEAVYDEPLLNALPFRERFRATLRRQLEAIEQQRALFVTMVLERPGIFSPVGDSADGPMHAKHQRWTERVAELLRAGIAEGALREGDVYEMGAFLMGAVNAMVVRWFSTPNDPPPLEQRLDQLIDMCFFGLALGEDPRTR